MSVFQKMRMKSSAIKNQHQRPMAVCTQWETTLQRPKATKGHQRVWVEGRTARGALNTPLSTQGIITIRAPEQKRSTTSFNLDRMQHRSRLGISALAEAWKVKKAHHWPLHHVVAAVYRAVAVQQVNKYGTTTVHIATYLVNDYTNDYQTVWI